MWDIVPFIEGDFDNEGRNKVNVGKYQVSAFREAVGLVKAVRNLWEHAEKWRRNHTDYGALAGRHA